MAFKMKKKGNYGKGMAMKGDTPNYMKSSPAKNYKNPQDYKVFNMGNEPTPMEMHGKHDGPKMEKTATYMKSPAKHTDFKTTGNSHRYSHNSGGTHDMPFTGKWHTTKEKKEKGITMKSPVKDKMSSSLIGEKLAKIHNEDYANNPDHNENMHGEGRNTSIAEEERKKGGPKMKSPIKDAGTTHFADMKKSHPDKYMRFAKKHDQAYGKGHPDSYHEMGQNPTDEEKKAFHDKRKAKTTNKMRTGFKMKSPMKDYSVEKGSHDHPHSPTQKMTGTKGKKV
jgi:hypothetical protein